MHVQNLVSDNDIEYFSAPFAKFMSDSGIILNRHLLIIRNMIVL